MEVTAAAAAAAAAAAVMDECLSPTEDLKGNP